MSASVEQREPLKIEKSTFIPKSPTTQKFHAEGPLAGSVEVFNSGNLKIHLNAKDLERSGTLDLTPDDMILYQQWLQLISSQ